MYEDLQAMFTRWNCANKKISNVGSNLKKYSNAQLRCVVEMCQFVFLWLSYTFYDVYLPVLKTQSIDLIDVNITMTSENNLLSIQRHKLNK